MKAAGATHCAGKQGKYWEMHNRLFSNPGVLARPDLSKYAQALGLDVVAFDRCVDTGKSAARIRKDIAEAQKLQATGTSTFFLGLTDPTVHRSRPRSWWAPSRTRFSRTLSSDCCRLSRSEGSCVKRDQSLHSPTEVSSVRRD